MGLRAGDLAFGLWRGAGLVLIDGNDAERSIVPPEAFGMPVEEAFPDPLFAPLRDAMRRCYETGERQVVIRPGGVVTFDRVDLATGRCVVSAYRATRPMPELPGIGPRFVLPLPRP